MTKEKKIKFLRERGWRDIWSLNHWVTQDQIDNPKCDIDRAGCTLEGAYQYEIEKDKREKLYSLPFNVMWEKIYGKKENEELMEKALEKTKEKIKEHIEVFKRLKDK
ncbi:MAG: hypothetical protein GY827_04475 [Cytophagales bacterium]|nr:hypothetical protein [Cytophagales bacterium]